VSKKKMMMKSRPVNEGDILKRLSAGLSEEEIRRILAGALRSLDEADVDRLLQRVGSETGAALRRVLDAGNSRRPIVPGRAKINEEWERNASSFIGGNLSLKEAWGLSFMVGTGIRPKSPIGFMPWPMPPGREKAVRIPSAPGYANGSTSLGEIAESCASRKAL
jgi:hypothetical protein